MYCPNCGLMNESGAKFCANCGTTLGAGGPVAPDPIPMQQPNPQRGPYQMQGPMTGGNSMLKNIGIGCLVAVVIFLFIGLSCTRACFRGHRRSYAVRHYH